MFVLARTHAFTQGSDAPRTLCHAAFRCERRNARRQGLHDAVLRRTHDEHGRCRFVELRQCRRSTLVRRIADQHDELVALLLPRTTQLIARGTRCLQLGRRQMLGKGVRKDAASNQQDLTRNGTSRLNHRKLNLRFSRGKNPRDKIILSTAGARFKS